MRQANRQRVAFLLGALALLVGVVATLIVWRARREVQSELEPPEPIATTKPAVPTPQAPQGGKPRPTTFPDARSWIAQHSYEDTRGRVISNWDIDEDGMYDKGEIVRYGTLRYDSRTERNAPRINLPPPSKPKVNRNDTDRDGLHDAWEKGYFGTLKYGPWDDPDGDGYPNCIEYADNKKSPVRIDLAPRSLRPKRFPKPAPPTVLARAPKQFDIRLREFWEAQDRAEKRLMAGEKSPGPAVKGFKWRKPKPKPPPKIPPPKPEFTPLQRRLSRLTGSAMGPDTDADADGLADDWERHYFGDLSQTRQDDPDGDGFPNVIEWYRLTDPTKVDLMDLRFKPAKLEDLPPPRTPWDHGWDIHSREFWEIQERLRAERAATRPAAAGGGA